MKDNGVGRAGVFKADVKTNSMFERSAIAVPGLHKIGASIS
jgi:hypothetical protein